MSSVVIANSSGVLSLPALLSNGYSKITIQNSQDGGTDRGIYLWANANTDWVMYMATSTGTTPSGSGTPPTGAFGFAQHAIRIRVANSNVYGLIYENTSNTCLFSLRADGAGGGMIGSWGVNTLSPSYNLHVVGSTYLNGNTITTGTVGIGITNPSYTLHVVGNIYASGDISALSDERHKQNITPLAESLSMITQLSGYSYTRTDYKPGEKQIGLIAQEVHALYPEAVSYDAANDTYSLNYGCLMAPVIQAIKELRMNTQNQIQSMQSEIDTLHDIIKKLRA